MWVVMCVRRHVLHTEARSCRSTGWALNSCFAWFFGTAAVLAQGGWGGTVTRWAVHRARAERHKRRLPHHQQDESETAASPPRKPARTAPSRHTKKRHRSTARSPQTVFVVRVLPEQVLRSWVLCVSMFWQYRPHAIAAAVSVCESTLARWAKFAPVFPVVPLFPQFLSPCWGPPRRQGLAILTRWQGTGRLGWRRE